MWWFSFECKNLVSIHKQSSPVFSAPHLVSLRCSSPKNCMHDGWTYLLSTCWLWAQQEAPWWVKQLQPPTPLLLRWLKTSVHQTSQLWPSEAISGTEPKCKGPGSDKSLPRESGVTAGVCWVRWCCQIKRGPLEDAKPDRGGGVSKVSRWQEPEWAEWSEEGWHAWCAESKRVGTEIKLWPLGRPHAHFLYTFLFCYASSKFSPSSTEYFCILWEKMFGKGSPLKNLIKCQFANFSWWLLVVPDVLPSSEYLIFAI